MDALEYLQIEQTWPWKIEWLALGHETFVLVEIRHQLAVRVVQKMYCVFLTSASQEVQALVMAEAMTAEEKWSVRRLSRRIHVFGLLLPTQSRTFAHCENDAGDLWR